MSSVTFRSVADIRAHIRQEVGVSEWAEDPGCDRYFAAVTNDQWIRVDPERAADKSTPVTDPDRAPVCRTQWPRLPRPGRSPWLRSAASRSQVLAGDQQAPDRCRPSVFVDLDERDESGQEPADRPGDRNRQISLSALLGQQSVSLDELVLNPVTHHE